VTSSYVEFRHNVDKIMGFAQHVSLTCGKCKWSYETFTSKQFKTPESDTRGAKSFDINNRSIIAFREIGRGHRSMEIFSSLMNLPPPLSATAYKNCIGTVYNSYEAAQNSMLNAAHDVNDSNGGIAEATVSDDGTSASRLCISKRCCHRNL